MSTPRLTIGMAVYDDWDGVYFTTQALRAYQDMRDVEILVVDNFGCKFTRDLISGWNTGRYILDKKCTGTAAPRNRVFQEARGEAVLCIDSHVLLMPGVVRKLKDYYSDNPKCNDLLQGPMMHDDIVGMYTHFTPVWSSQMFGVWDTDARGKKESNEPFEIPMCGLGLFSCRKDAWLKFNDKFKGFGGEEGYIHEKFRQAGNRTMCMPWLRWIHRFNRAFGAPYVLRVEDKFQNYIIGFTELGLDTKQIFDHFVAYRPIDTLEKLAQEALAR